MHGELQTMIGGWTSQLFSGSITNVAWLWDHGTLKEAAGSNSVAVHEIKPTRSTTARLRCALCKYFLRNQRSTIRWDVIW